MEKVLIECCLELFRGELVEGIQDLGAAGISCATSELASNGDGGMHVELDTVLLRDPTLTAGEILMSESQERMMAVVEPANVERFMDICRKWDVLATTVGEVIEGDRLIIQWHGETIVDVDPKTVAHEGPVYERPYHRPAWLDGVNADRAELLPRDNTPEGLRAALFAVLSHPNVADKTWVTQQYDRYVRGNTVLAQPEDSGMLRIDEETGLGIALSLDANSRFSYLNPYLGAQLSLAEAYRNVAVTGAEPVAITDCLNFGSPEDPEVMWQFAEAILGLVDGCRELGVPVTGGNVSLYNQTATTPILPTPTIGVLGVIDDVATRIRAGFTVPGEVVLLLGETREELSGSIWEAAINDGHLGGMPPAEGREARPRVVGARRQRGRPRRDPRRVGVPRQPRLPRDAPGRRRDRRAVRGVRRPRRRLAP
jgi:phosphoribosylformylglycinamidine synthase